MSFMRSLIYHTKQKLISHRFKSKSYIKSKKINHQSKQTKLTKLNKKNEKTITYIQRQISHNPPYRLHLQVVNLQGHQPSKRIINSDKDLTSRLIGHIL